MKVKALIIALLVVFKLNAQIDSTAVYLPKTDQKNSFLKSSIIPFSIIGVGLYVNYSNGNLGKVNLQNEIQNGLNDFETSLDDFLFVTPSLVMYGADLLKIESKNDAFTQTKFLGIALLANGAITYTLKKITNEVRPNGEADSFPSGHTSMAFVMATVLHREFNDTNKWVAYSGYFLATGTAVLRVLNNEHWVSDVLVGAGIGMIVADLVYRIEPLKNWQPLKKKQWKVMLSPTFENNTMGIYANLQF
ncbi:phosphatase PAP2 family protein [Namhaeicola litoreus]|uniref:Phosphatase PAP2 family protein n=1 Tax=Namhaeicola litoreus TaxID=1052145 RepID=A0ABW3Y3H8_9FLAO